VSHIIEHAAAPQVGGVMRTLTCLIALLSILLSGNSLQAQQQDHPNVSQAPPPARAARGTPAAFPAPVKLTGRAAWGRLIGNSIIGTEEGKPLVEYYAADGTAKSMTDNKVYTGKWTFAGESVCFSYGDASEGCLIVEVFGNSVTFYNEKAEGERYQILEGNPSGL
jgi:hypothetical protein